jgi:6-pyruvoyltetrahydropterin/6-carboxytetrahydropterin synthase
MYSVTKTFNFDSAHRLWDTSLTEEQNYEVFGKCANAPCHGHTYFVEITLKSQNLTNGMVRNFSELKKVYNEKIHNKYDHQFLNNLMPFLTTAENIAEFFFNILKEDFPEITSVAVYETPTSRAEYSKE